jgi:DNA-binding transcriptional regulator YbjK
MSRRLQWSVASPKERALDAAVELVGTEGLRALTHVRVDERASLPRGSTSNYFRTRAALLSGVVDRIVERELSEVGTAISAASAASLVDTFCGLLDHVTVRNRTMTAARLVLFMEASHRPALRDAVTRGRTSLESEVVAALARLGAPDPAASATALMACLEGLILHRVVRHDHSDPRPILELVVRGALG